MTFVTSLNLNAQSKKEQIATLTARLDSLNKEYVKDTTYLSNTVETLDREYTIISMQYDEAKEELQKKSATITDKSNTIKSLNVKNMDLMKSAKDLNSQITELKEQVKLSNLEIQMTKLSQKRNFKIHRSMVNSGKKKLK